MDYALFALGAAMFAVSFWQWKSGRREAINKEEIIQLQGELVKAKQDVSLLLDELKSVSEQVVNEISEKIGAAQELGAAIPEAAVQNVVNTVPKATDIQAKPVVTIDPVVVETAERIAKSAIKSAARPQAKKEPKVIDINLHKQSQEAASGRNMGARFETVYTLSDLGYSISEIAKQLQMGRGEVELILSIRHREGTGLS